MGGFGGVLGGSWGGFSGGFWGNLRGFRGSVSQGSGVGLGLGSFLGRGGDSTSVLYTPSETNHDASPNIKSNPQLLAEALQDCAGRAGSGSSMRAPGL